MGFFLALDLYLALCRVKMEVEIFHTPILLPGLIAKEIQLQKQPLQPHIQNAYHN